jgi:hypothetical protein
MVLHCYMCKHRFSNISCLCFHLRKSHALQYNGADVHCGQNNCPRIFSSFAGLKKHIRKSHFELLQFDSDRHELNTIGSGVSHVCLDKVDNVQRDQNIIQGCDNSTETLLDLPTSIMQFVTKLQSQPNVLMSNVDNTVKDFQELLSDVSNFGVTTVKQLCKELNINIALPEVGDTISQFQGIPQIVESVNTEYKRLKCLRKYVEYVEPNEIVLGSRTDVRFDAKLGFTKPIVVQDTMQYIPIEKLLGAVLSDPMACKLIEEKQKHASQHENNIISDYSDTESYRQHPFFMKHPDAFIIHLYVDGFETTNELGSHTQVHKLEGLYMVIKNIPAKYLSKLNAIFLVGLWYAHDVKTYGYDKLLAPTVAALKELETESGITVNIKGQPTVIRGVLSLFSADNLGLHSLFGFLESFSANKFCHFCECTKEEAQAKFMENDFTLRTKASYNESVRGINLDPKYNPSETGIKRGCILNELKYFHVISNQSVDAMHDILEGIVTFEIALVLETLITLQFFSLDYLNSCISSFDYDSSDRNSKPSTFSSVTSMHLNAAEAMCFIRNLPLMVGNKIPREEPHWQLLLMLLDILDIVFAPRVTPGLSSYLGHLIAEHHAHLKEMYPSKRLLPKHHFLVHYQSCLLRCGTPTGY